MALGTAGPPAVSSAHGPGPVTSLTFLDRPMGKLFELRQESECEGLLFLFRCRSDLLGSVKNKSELSHLCVAVWEKGHQRRRRAITDTHVPLLPAQPSADSQCPVRVSNLMCLLLAVFPFLV